jgi:hypothetical protein
VVKELHATGLKGDALLREIMRLTGLPASQASLLIAIELGKSKGCIVGRSPRVQPAALDILVGLSDDRSG